MNNHVDSIHRNCMTKLRMLYKIHGFICQNTAALMHDTMIHPYMDCGNFTIDSVHISKIDTLVDSILSYKRKTRRNNCSLELVQP